MEVKQEKKKSAITKAHAVKKVHAVPNYISEPEPQMGPVRCFTCGKVIGAMFTTYYDALQKGVTPEIALDKLGLSRYCCRRMLLSNKKVDEQVNLFSGYIENLEEANMVNKKKK